MQEQGDVIPGAEQFSTHLLQFKLFLAKPK